MFFLIETKVPDPQLIHVKMRGHRLLIQSRFLPNWGLRALHAGAPMLQAAHFQQAPKVMCNTYAYHMETWAHIMPDSPNLSLTFWRGSPTFSYLYFCACPSRWPRKIFFYAIKKLCKRCAYKLVCGRIGGSRQKN